jgi:NADH-quinone oxidoreductase subunit L
MRNMGGLRNRMKTTFWVYLIGALALAGIFPLAGFWSKDEILAEALHLNPAVYWLLTIAAFFTAFYMGRQIIMIFFGEPKSEPAAQAKESPAVMTIPLIVLAGLSLVGGFMNLPFLHTFTRWLEHTINLGEAAAAAEATGEAAAATPWYMVGGLNLIVAGISLGLALIAIAVSWYFYTRRTAEIQKLPIAKRPDDPLRGVLGPVFSVLENKYWVDELYWAVIANPYVVISRFLAEKVDWAFWHDFFHDKVIVGGYNGLTWLLSKPIDLGFIDGIANGLGQGTQELAASMRKLQSGFVRNYALSVFIGVVVIIGYLILQLR